MFRLRCVSSDNIVFFKQNGKNHVPDSKQSLFDCVVVSSNPTLSACLLYSLDR